MKTITPKEYEKLQGKDRLGWRPQYVGYKTKKVRDYYGCDCCGHQEFAGWVERSFPIGEPISYKYEKPGMWEHIGYDMAVSQAKAMELYYKKSLGNFSDERAGDVIHIPFLGSSK